MLFGNQLGGLFEGVGVKRAESAVRGPRFYDGLAKAVERGFIYVLSFREIGLKAEFSHFSKYPEPRSRPVATLRRCKNC